MKHKIAGLLAGAATLLAVPSAQARITRVVIDQVVSPVFEGESFGAAGQYEKIRGRLIGEVDPAQAENRRIQDIALAPRNAAGRVEYTADFLLLRPVADERIAPVLQLNLVNRGRTLGLIYNVGAPQGGATDSVDPTTRADAGDGFVMRRGSAVLYLGWQGDLAAGDNRLRLAVPVATRQGAPLTGPVRVTLKVDSAAGSASIAGGGAPQVAYPAADLAEPGAVLRHRGATGAAWSTLPRADWAFATCAPGGFPGTPDPRAICLKGNFDPSQDYELTYTARDPLVLGLGLAAIRDTASFFHHAARDSAGTPNPLAGRIKYVLATGLSQDGNLMRNLVQLGFNRDESGRRAFDGMMAHLSGKRTPINVRFAAPGATSTLFEGPLNIGHETPLTWQRERDPLTGKPAGLLDRCRATATCPRVFDTFTSTEFRQYAMAYTWVDPMARRDLVLPANVRVYFLTGSQHGTADSQAKPIPPGVCQLARNHGPNMETQRALLVAMEDWLTAGRAPPPSRVPTLAARQLASPSAAGWPAIPGVTYPTRSLVPTPTDWGAGFDAVDESGITGRTPRPRASVAFPPLVPRVDADGNETSGIRPTAIQVPFGTYTGWNTRRAGFGEGELCGLSGGFVPFAATKAERLAKGDPRPSLEERYATHDDYVRAVYHAAAALQGERFLLPEDAARLVHEAETSGIGR